MRDVAPIPALAVIECSVAASEARPRRHPSSTGATHAAGWVFVISAALAWYVGTGMMLKGAAGQIVLPLFKTDKESNTPGARPTCTSTLSWRP